MSPTFQDGERLLVRRYRGAPIDTGDIVVFAPPAGTDPRTGDPRWRIKRVAATAGEAVPAWLSAEPGAAARVPAGHLVVVGDNATSQDSRHLGFIPVSSVVAVIRRRPSVGASPGASAAR
jgi:signal peptidase I